MKWIINLNFDLIIKTRFLDNGVMDDLWIVYPQYSLEPNNEMFFPKTPLGD
jgi:hypothetical protein